MERHLTTLQELALDLTLTSYESAESIAEQIKLLLGNGVSLQQISGALEVLREQGLVHAYHYREVQKDYKRYRRETLRRDAKISWRATDDGRREAKASAHGGDNNHDRSGANENRGAPEGKKRYR